MKTKKVAHDALVFVCIEKKVKVILVENARRKAAQKATLQSYFSSSRGSSSSQPFSLVLDSHFPDVLGAESDGVEDYSSTNSTRSEHTMSIDTIVTPTS